LASQVDSITAAVALDQAKAELIRAQKVIKINGGNTQGEYEVKAPISGFIVQKLVTNDQVIRSDNGNALFIISDLKNVWIWANVYESNVDNIHLGDDIIVSTLSYPGRTFKGKVDKIMQMLDPTTKAMKVRVSINNDDYALKPQMFASVTVTNTENKQALYIPSSALIFDHSQYYVLVYSGKGKAEITPVQKLNSLGQKTYLISGVKIGDRIISSETLQIYGELNN
jgi:cobalt-zinc-cadmium efflux system membrane fusion protein